MIDIHCHILPGLDDGAADMQEAVAMARLAYEDGIRHIVATPHFTSAYPNGRAVVESGVRALQAELDREGLAVTIHPGNEVRLEDAARFRREAESGAFCFLDRQESFVLLEQPWSGYNPETAGVVAWLRERGVTPVIPHPERHYFFRDNLPCWNRL
ncbi:hypothetical protein N6H14_13900 [Paenibacillus sp. CC-CFT747]|nr:hypothetical protein N6H14_13900 [Paenibacillus sp. CC-CFT747]